METLKKFSGKVFFEIKVKKGFRKDLGRPTTTPKKNKEDLHRIIASKNRSEAGYSVPAKALFLTKIEYPNSIFL